MTKRVIVALLFLACSAFGQGSLIGQTGCNAAPITGTGWTSATSLNTTQTLLANSPGPMVLVTLDQTSTLTVGAVTFQGDPGDGNAITVPAAQLLDPATRLPIANPYTLQASTNKVFLVDMSGFYKLILKLSTAITGTATVTPFTTPLCYQIQPLVVYNSSLPTLTNGQAATPQVDAKGQLLVDLNYLNGGAIDTNSGSKSAATIRTVQATDQPALTNAQPANVTQVGGTSLLAGNGATGTGSPRVTIASDNSPVAGMGVAATGGAVPANASYSGAVSSGNLTGIIGCDHSDFLDMTTATTTQIVALSSSKIIYVCELGIEGGGTSTVTMKYGTGSNCGTGTTSIGPGWEVTAQSGISEGAGIGMIYKNIASNALCFTSSQAVNVHIHVAWTQF